MPHVQDALCQNQLLVALPTPHDEDVDATVGQMSASFSAEETVGNNFKRRIRNLLAMSVPETLVFLYPLSGNLPQCANAFRVASHWPRGGPFPVVCVG